MTELHVSLSADAAFTSIQAAYDALVAQKANGTLTFPAVIWVHGGVYRINKALQFQEDLPVTIKAYHNEEVVIDGGVNVSDWKQTVLNGKRVFRADLPTEEITQLYVNGTLRYPASIPKAPDYFEATDELPFTFYPTPENGVRFHYDGNDFDPAWYDPQNILIVAPHLWVEDRAKIEAVDTETKTITLQSAFCYQALKGRTIYRFYNVREGLAPGEYYIDRIEKAIYYLPRKGETLKNISAVIPKLGTLAEINGAQWLTLEGLTFRHGGSFYPVCDKYFDLRNGSVIRNSMVCEKFIQCLKNTCKPLLQGYQASMQLPGIILFNESQNCVVRNCTVENSGWYGIAVERGCRNITLESNNLHHLGGGGVRIAGGRYEEDPALNDPVELQTSHIIVRGNHIHDCCEIYLSAVGVFLTDARSCLIENNHIHDLYYSGISCGWTWGFAPQVTAENRIIGNHIHDLGKGVMSDMGGVYLLGIQPGTRVADNVIHDIRSRCYGGWGLYTDEGSAHIVLEHNLVYNCSCEAFHQHFGRENIVRENVLACGGDAVIAVTNLRDECYTSPGQNYGKAISFYRNLIITNGAPFYRMGSKEILPGKWIDSENNLFCNVSGQETRFVWCRDKNSFIGLKDWQEMGYDLNGELLDDCGFEDPANGNFSLKQTSALKDHPRFQWLKKVR